MGVKQIDLSFKKIMLRLSVSNELWYHKKDSVKHKVIFGIFICEHKDIMHASILELTILNIRISLGIIQGK
jgi:hypothetical protein